jgi:hypothetical protein
MAETRMDIDTLRGLPEGSVVITHRVAWAKIGPDEWRCPLREHVPDRSISQRWRGRFRWHDEKDSEWLAEVATEVVYNPNGVRA